MESLFYEPNISKPIRGKRDVKITLNKKGVLEGIPTAWREVLELPPQEQEVDEIDEVLEISKEKLKKIEKEAAKQNIIFELTAVIKAPKRASLSVMEDDEDHQPEYGRDRTEDEERPSYVITIKKRKFRPIVQEVDETPADLELEEEPERKYTVMLDEKTGEFTGLPEELKDQIENSGFNKKQITEHPEQVLQVLSYASKQAAAEEEAR